VRSELVSAFLPRAVCLMLMTHLAGDVLKGVAYVFELFPKLKDTVMAEAAKEFERNMSDLISQLVELDSWLYDPGVDELGCGNWLIANGYSYEKLRELMKKAKSYQGGRPPTKKNIAVQVLDARRLGRNLTWRTLTDKFCDCEKLQHDDLCIEALRKSAAQLESLLKKYRQLAVPAETFAAVAQLFLDRMGWEQRR
jgi:hypothetical protein